MLAASPGERLRTLRHIFGFTQSRLAVISGVRQSWISEVEGLSKEPSKELLVQISNATGTPLSFFYVQPKSVPLDSLRFRKRASVNKSTTERVHAVYGESFRISDTLISDEEYPKPPLPYATEDELGQERIEELAAQAREALRIAPDKPIPNLTRAMERAGIAVAPIMLNHDSVEVPTVGGHDGVSYWAGLGETALVGYFPGWPGDRERFTLAHELGHLVLHTFRPFAADPETEAHRFAGAFLMPKIRAEQDVNGKKSLTDFARMKATWGISIQALIMRGVALGSIDERRHRSLYVQLSAKGWRKSEPVTVGNESPVLLWTLLRRRFGERPYLNAADKLAVPASLLRSVVPVPNKSASGSGEKVGANTATVRSIRPQVH